MLLRSRLVAVCLLLLAGNLPAQQSPLGTPTQVADGVLLYQLNDPALLNPPAPIAVQALRLDPRKTSLRIERARAVAPARETVAAIAARLPDAVAAINAGFFSLETGRPTDFLKVDGEVVSDTSRARGAVGFLDRDQVMTLLFDRVRVSTRNGRSDYSPLLGTSSLDWARTKDAVSGAGLLMLDGRELTDWTEEVVSAKFDTTRHPRTMIGTDAQGAIWLVTVDGRNVAISWGMTFAELKVLARRLGLRSALNLDGGGSTTMWVDGKIVNHPSDPEGPRKVSEAIIVGAAQAAVSLGSRTDQ
jgi:exopolysaccharide biosynthesis protein